MIYHQLNRNVFQNLSTTIYGKTVKQVLRFRFS